MHSRETLLPKTLEAVLDQAGMSPAQLADLL